MRMLRNRVLSSIVALLLLCAMGTTAQAGVVPWLWNFMFGPANAPLFPRRAYAARPFVAGRFASPVVGYGYAAPVTAWSPTVSYAPAGCCTTAYAPTYSYATSGCGTCTDYCASYAPSVPVVSYSPVVSSNCCASSTTFEYSGYISNGCGTIYNGVVSGGTVSDGVVIDKSNSSYEGGSSDDSTTVTEPPVLDNDRPEPGSGMGDDDKFLPPKDTGRAPVGDDAFDDIDLDGLGGANKPVAEDKTDETPAAKSPGPDAKRIRPTYATVSLKGELGRFTQLRRTMTRTRLSESNRTLRWISVPSDGRRTRM